MKLALVATFVTTSSFLVTAQDTSKCPDETYQSIIRCTDQVYADEGKAPCSSSDWEVSFLDTFSLGFVTLNDRTRNSASVRSSRASSHAMTHALKPRTPMPSVSTTKTALVNTA